MFQTRERKTHLAFWIIIIVLEFLLALIALFFGIVNGGLLFFIIFGIVIGACGFNTLCCTLALMAKEEENGDGEENQTDICDSAERGRERKRRTRGGRRGKESAV